MIRVNARVPIVIALAALQTALGCGSDAPSDLTIYQEYVTVRDAQDRQQTIPLDDLLAARGEGSPYRSVLAIDRRTGRQAWVEIEQLGQQPPSQARFIPVTQERIRDGDR